MSKVSAAVNSVMSGLETPKRWLLVWAITLIVSGITFQFWHLVASLAPFVPGDEVASSMAASVAAIWAHDELVSKYMRAGK